ncbi:Tim44 domain-containing protein [Salinicola acroporae]|uniref:Transporter n=1 Tax=Salinicola acroporae TaxID=1541440 RepID=A0ABT6I9T3_9GAMM|nr:TIM44-like domain-containing protein [Salinicola acroporae]MDH4574328.1 transporter [Salinicola acroporae]
MRHLLVMLMVGMLGFAAAVDHAEARRMGGGKSFGSYSRSVQQPTPTTTRTNASAPPRQPSAGLSRFASPLAGMLAGGLLASLFFGGAFDGFRMMDFLLIALVAFIGFRLLAGRRRHAPAGHRDEGQPHHDTSAQPAPFMSSGAPGMNTGGIASEPEWFDRERFLAGAKEHFTTLQRAWDNNDLSRIQEYVTPELYNLLKTERMEQPANNRTEIVRLFAELGSVQEFKDEAEATVLFHGVLEENGEENEFNETWHLKRALRDGAPWYVQGIEQNPNA